MLKNILHIQNERNKMLRNNILQSTLLKGVGLLSSLLIVPTTINYLNQEVYGVWMTITSILFWIGAFDIGLGNGMRNYLTEALSKKDYAKGREYLSSTFILLSIVALAIFLILLAPIFSLNFNKVFNITSITNEDLRNALLVAICFTLLNFVIKNVGIIFLALQRYALNDLLNVAGNVLSLLIIYILTKTTKGNLMYVVFVYTCTYSVVYLLAFVPVFNKYPQLKPSFSAFNKDLMRQIVGKGLGFFTIQITSCLVIFGAANFFITQYCGPSDVTVYNIAYKYFNLLIIAYTILISPMWNAYTEAYVNKDFAWIGQNFNRALKFWGLSVVAGAGMLGMAGIFYRLWIGEQVQVPFSVSLSVLIYVCFFNLNNCVTYLINGLNKIKVQIITSIAFTLAYIITVFFTGSKFGIEGITLSMAACYAGMSMIHLYQCRLLIKQKATSVWNS